MTFTCKGYLTELRDTAHSNAIDKGFWMERLGVGIEHKSGNLMSCLMLVVTEIAEAAEAERHGNRDGKDGVAEELADAVIRIFDLCGGYDIDIAGAILDKMAFNATRPELHGKEC